VQHLPHWVQVNRKPSWYQLSLMMFCLWPN
jgi:hypothetical protein